MLNDKLLACTGENSYAPNLVINVAYFEIPNGNFYEYRCYGARTSQTAGSITPSTININGTDYTVTTVCYTDVKHGNGYRNDIEVNPPVPENERSNWYLCRLDNQLKCQYTGYGGIGTFEPMHFSTPAIFTNADVGKSIAIYLGPNPPF